MVLIPQDVRERWCGARREGLQVVHGEATPHMKRSTVMPAVCPDGDRFLVVRGGGAGGFGDVYIVVNWFEELRQRMGN